MQFFMMLACGWILMVPQLSGPEELAQGKRTVASDRPLKQWHHAQSFDTAKECEDHRALAVKEARQRKHKVQEEQHQLARCIPADAYEAPQ